MLQKQFKHKYFLYYSYNLKLFRLQKIFTLQFITLLHLFVARKPCTVPELVDNNRESENDTDDEITYQPVAKKAVDKKKVGRKGRWITSVLDDFIGVITNNEAYKDKLIFRNTKNQQNGILYEKIQKELKARSAEREEDFTFSIAQLRSKFKKCVGECKKAALTIRSASGIKQLQENKGYGAWFNQLFALVRNHDSCQPELAVEPSAGVAAQENKTSADCSNQQNHFATPFRANRRGRHNESTNAIAEVLSLVKSIQ